MERDIHPTPEQAVEPTDPNEVFEKMRIMLAQAKFDDPYMGNGEAIRLITEQDPELSAIADQDLQRYITVANNAAKSLEGWTQD